MLMKTVVLVEECYKRVTVVAEQNEEGIQSARLLDQLHHVQSSGEVLTQVFEAVNSLSQNLGWTVG